ncbi:MAG: hypothetical protein QN423_01070 [Nitrososphaeraceae archaeon]|nr:hypothetical protein [Nitrososphaeraceae archaeon]
MPNIGTSCGLSPKTNSGLGCEVNQIIAAGTAAQTIIVRSINQTAVILSAIIRLTQAKYLKLIFAQCREF